MLGELLYEIHNTAYSNAVQYGCLVKSVKVKIYPVNILDQHKYQILTKLLIYHYMFIRPLYRVLDKMKCDQLKYYIRLYTEIIEYENGKLDGEEI